MTYTADDLIKSIKRGVTVPNYQALLTDADMLELADEETMSLVVPVLMSLRSEYLVVVESVPVVPSSEFYDIPYRAIGRGLRDLLYEIDGLKRNLAYIAPEDVHYYSNNSTASDPRGFCFVGDKIRLIPGSINSEANVEISYHIRPGKLIQTKYAGKVTAFNKTNKTITLNALPANVTTSCDIVRAKQGANYLDWDVAVTAINGTTLTVDAVPSDIAVGDWVCEPEKSPVIQIPEECMQTLAQAVQCRILEAVGDTEGFNVAKIRLEEKIRQMKDLLVPRVEGEPQKVVNRGGLLRRRQFLRSNRRYVG